LNHFTWCKDSKAKFGYNGGHTYDLDQLLYDMKPHYIQIENKPISDSFLETHEDLLGLAVFLHIHLFFFTRLVVIIDADL